MQSTAPEPPAEPTTPTTQDAERSSPSHKRRRLSQSSSVKTPKPEPSDEPSSSRSSRVPRVSRAAEPPPTEGSSRDADDMHRSSTPPEVSSSAIKYTKTGRVSKATKGKRVHNCDECGKTYTRAEHLRRHQQNHQPGAFACDYPGCDQSYFREDLLIRHKARHNEHAGPSVRRPSFDSQTSVADTSGSGAGPAPLPPAPTSSRPPIVSSETQTTPSESSSQQPDVSRPPKRPTRPHELLRSSIPVVLPGLEPYADLDFGLFYPETSPSSSEIGDVYESPAAGHYATPYFAQSQSARARNFSDTSYLGLSYPNASQSPASAVSSTASLLPQWIAAPPLHQSGTNSPYGSGILGTPPHQQVISHSTYGTQRHFTIEDRDLMEQQDLIVPGVSLDGSLDDDCDSMAPASQLRYLSSYWQKVHPLFPVVHRPSFDMRSGSPLLQAAIIALGSQALGGRDDLSLARDIHERCAKILQRRTMLDTHTSNLCDLQAIVLIEIYSVFKSRRPPAQLSEPFVNVYQMLERDPQALNVTNAEYGSHDSSSFYDSYPVSTCSSLTSQTKQRLLLTCYILDQHHATLFGRRQSASIAELGLNLPFPSSQVYWDTDTPEYERGDTAGISSFASVSDALRSIPYMMQPAQEPHDTFRSMLLLSCLSDPVNEMQMVGCVESAEPPPMKHAITNSATVKLAFHTLMMCKALLLRELLAIVGESWVMAEKLSNETEYSACQIDVRRWFQDRASVQRALSHAFCILAIVRTSGRTNLPFQEWSTYLASVVVWANFYVSQDQRQSTVSIPNTAEARPPQHELEPLMATLLQRGPTAAFSWQEVRAILQWTRSSVERVDMPHTCGLVSGVLDVLGKLITRGNEAGWF